MSTLSVRMASIAAALLVAASASQLPIHAAQNPITAAREAFRKAQEEAKRKAQEEAQRRAGQQPGQPPSQPQAATPTGTTPVIPSASSAATTPETTAKLAAALGFVDVAGLKLGMPLKDVEGVLKSINAKLQLRPEVEIVWPIDRNNTAAQPPPNAPKSVTSIAADSVAFGQGSEAIHLQAAVHPNPAVLIQIERTVNYEAGKGPNFDVVLDGLRKKYGPESAVMSEMTNNAQRSLRIKWFFDERGQPLRGNLASQIVQTCGPNVTNPPGLCSTLTVIDVGLEAGGSGIVRTLRVLLGSSPLLKSANDVKQNFLRQVEEDRAKQQRIESSQRATPKL